MSNKVNLDLNKLVNFCQATYNNTEKNLLSNIVSTVPNMPVSAHNNLINPTIIKNINTCKIGNIRIGNIGMGLLDTWLPYKARTQSQ